MASSRVSDKPFYTDYILLNKREEAGFLDMLMILISGDISKRSFVDCPEGTRVLFNRRWIIFVSMLAMKLLSVVSKPLAGLGSRIEDSLNLLSDNGGFFGLLHNIIKGKVIYPDSSSASYLSVVGHLDKRVGISRHDSYDKRVYNAELSMMASKISYENPNFIESVVKDHWNMDFLGFHDFWNDYEGKTTTQAFLLADKHETIVVSFRGTSPFNADDWSTDVDISWYELPGLGNIHGGFMKALGLQKGLGWPENQPDDQPLTAYYAIRKMLKQYLEENEKAKFIVTGHSLGGALAILFPAVLALHGEVWLLDRLEGVYTYGQPRVGDKKFGEFMTNVVKRYGFDYFRFVYNFDFVPRLPYDDATLMFKHFGTCVQFNSLYRGKVVAEEANKNYFSIKWSITKLFSAWWELIRSFLLPYIEGSEYKETNLLRLLRVFGLTFPGVIEHVPFDYVNTTKLGFAQVLTSLNNGDTYKILKAR